MTKPHPNLPALPAARVEPRGVGGWLRRFSARTRYAVWSSASAVGVLAMIVGTQATIDHCRNNTDEARGRRARQAAYDRTMASYEKRCPRAVYVCFQLDVVKLPRAGGPANDPALPRHEQSLGARLAADHPRFARLIGSLRALRGEQLLAVLASVAELQAVVDEFQLGGSSRALLKGLRADARVTAYLRATRDLASREEPGAPPFDFAFVDDRIGGEVGGLR